jgi:type II secretory pathway component PulK
VSNDTSQDGVINVNSAGVDVLACLPGVDRTLATAIANYRQSTGFLPNVATLLKVPGMTRDIFKQVAPLVAARSETFRILCEGRVGSSGTRRRIEAIVRVGVREVSTVEYREDDL